MELIIKQEESILHTITAEFEWTKDSLKPFQSLDLYTTLNNELTISLNKLEQEIMDTKKDKYLREVQDYAQGAVYVHNRSGGLKFILRCQNREDEGIKVSTDTHNPITFVTNFSHEYDSIKEITSKYFLVLDADSVLVLILSAGCRFSSCCSQTLANILSLSSSGYKKTWLQVQGSYICGSSTCHFCTKHNNKHKTIVACATGKEFTIHNYIHCGSSNVVYTIACTLCKLQYMWWTRSLRAN